MIYITTETAFICKSICTVYRSPAKAPMRQKNSPPSKDKDTPDSPVKRPRQRHARIIDSDEEEENGTPATDLSPEKLDEESEAKPSKKTLQGKKKGRALTSDDEEERTPKKRKEEEGHDDDGEKTETSKKRKERKREDADGDEERAPKKRKEEKRVVGNGEAETAPKKKKGGERKVDDGQNQDESREERCCTPEKQVGPGNA